VSVWKNPEAPFDDHNQTSDQKSMLEDTLKAELNEQE